MDWTDQTLGVRDSLRVSAAALFPLEGQARELEYPLAQEWFRLALADQFFEGGR